MRWHSRDYSTWPRAELPCDMRNELLTVAVVLVGAVFIIIAELLFFRLFCKFATIVGL